MPAPVPPQHSEQGDAIGERQGPVPVVLEASLLLIDHGNRVSYYFSVCHESETVNDAKSRSRSRSSCWARMLSVPSLGRALLPKDTTLKGQYTIDMAV